VAHRAGAGPAVAAGGLVCLISALSFRSRLPALRDEARRLLGESGEAGSGLSGSA
jgi:hypothetical protein